MIRMLPRQGIQVIHYGVGSTNPGAAVHHEVMSEAEQVRFLGHDHSDPTAFHGQDAQVDNPAYLVFNARLRPLLDAHVEKDELVLLPFGTAHYTGTRTHRGINVESGIGYPGPFEKFRIYESFAWLHHHAAKEGRGVSDTEFVIPNYFETEKWKIGRGDGGYALFFGRIQQDKGLDYVWALANAMPEQEFVICGQGDPTPWLTLPNLSYRPPVLGDARSDLLGAAKVLLAPSRYIEPFCGVTVEANLCGTPVLTSTAGAFAETVIPGFNGHRCRTLSEWTDGIRHATALPRELIRGAAVGRYSLEAVGPQYARAFAAIQQLHSPLGWYS